MSLSFIYPQYLWLLLLVPLTVALGLFGRRAITRARFWGGLAVRVILLLSIIAALAGIQLRLRSNTLSVVFLLDVSDSVSQAEQARGEALVRQAIAEMPSGDRAAIVVFGEDALVERLATAEKSLADITSTPVTSRTDIGGALQLALALFPNEGAKRMVLFSDGRENLNRAIEQAELAAINGIELLYTPLGEEQGDQEVLVEAVEAPADVRQGQSFDLQVVVNSRLATGATLHVFEGGTLLESREVQLQPGINRFQTPFEAKETGFRRFRAQIVPDTDSRLQNNEASAFTIVHGPPRVLVVEGKPGEADNLQAALEAAEMDVQRVAAENIPVTLPELASYDAVVLVNVHASALPSGVMEALPVYERDLGKGLVMIGGQESFGAGGYLRTPLEKALPVDMDVKNRELTANLALVLVVDKSGSMGRCHCDSPDLNQSYTRQNVGQPKVDIAKEAIMRAASALGDQDYLGVVSFDSQARWALKTVRLVDSVTLERSIGGITAEGNTNVFAGVEAAFESLKDVDARRKHVILLTDGWSREGDVSQLVEEMKAQGITLSVVAAGGGSAEYLKVLSELGGGRYYPAEDILSVPDIFLKETVTSVGEYIIEEPFYPLAASPSPVLSGLNPQQLPALLGYNGTTSKRTARLDLLTPRGDPLLATWQYGLGRSAVWTSDLKGQWASEWLKWDGFSRFAAQLVGWTLPAPAVEGLSAQASVENGMVQLQLSAQDKNSQPLNFLNVAATVISPDLTTQEVKLEQMGSGRYQASLDLSQPGTYLARLGANQGDQSLGQVTMGVVVPYSPEYRAGGIDRGLLGELARLTGGSELVEPVAAFVHNLPAADFAREIWRPLLLLAALLFPLDVAVRRVALSKMDLLKARAWVMAQAGFRRAGLDGSTADGKRALGNLFQARERARQRMRGGEAPDVRQPPPVTPDISPPEPDQSVQPPASGSPVGPPDGDAFDRLRQAKKRARR